MPTIRWTYNNLPHGTLGVSPYHLTFGHPGKTKLAQLKAEFLVGAENVVDPKLNKSDTTYLADLKTDFKRVQDVADNVAKRAQQEYVGHCNKHAHKKVFAVNDRVLVLRPSSTIAVRSQWIGPCVVEEVGVANAYWVRFPDGGRKSVHASQLRPYVARVDQVGVSFDNERLLEDLRTCPLSDDVVHVPETVHVGRFGKLELTYLSPGQRRQSIVSLEEFGDILYGKTANQIDAVVVRKDRVGVG